MATSATDFAAHPRAIFRPSHYTGETVLGVTATQLEGTGLGSADRKRVLGEWIEFFGSGPTSIRELQLLSRVPQELIDSLRGQTQLEVLYVKWGPYRDISALGGLANLTTLRLGAATSLTGIEPLLRLPALTSLALIQAHKTDATPVLAELTGLVSLTFGNDLPGSDKSVTVPNLEWVRSLHELRTLALPGTRILDPDLAPLLALPHLEHLRLPLRREYRSQAFEFAATSPVFAQVARDFEAYDHWRAKA